MAKPDEMMTASDVASVMRVSVRTVWRMRAKGSLPRPRRIGRCTRWNSRDIANYLRTGHVKRG